MSGPLHKLTSYTTATDYSIPTVPKVDLTKGATTGWSGKSEPLPPQKKLDGPLQLFTYLFTIL